MSSTGGRDQPRMNTNGHESVTPQAALQLLFLGSLHDSSIAHWGHERRLLARSPGFSRPDVLPPEGGTPCKSRFMESIMFEPAPSLVRGLWSRRSPRLQKAP